MTLTGRLPGRLGPQQVAGFLLDLFKAKELTQLAVGTLISLLEESSSELEGVFDVDFCKLTTRRVSA